jgi:hypothetical protein
MLRHEMEHSSPGSERRMHLLEHALIVGDVLKNVERRYEVEACRERYVRRVEVYEKGAVPNLGRR